MISAVDWNDQADALDFVMRHLRDWQTSGQLTERQVQHLSERYEKQLKALQSARDTSSPSPTGRGERGEGNFEPDENFPPADECWSCGTQVDSAATHCEECGAPIAAAAVKSLRYWRFLHRELREQEDAGWLALRQAHELIGEVKERIAALKQKLERDRAPYVTLADEPTSLTPFPSPSGRGERGEGRRGRREESAARGRSLLEIALDPQSIQWLLAAGGVLIVVGLVIWLASSGFFDQPGRVAIALGVGNAVLLLGGWALMLRTGYQVAGRALTLLACLLMPLNLWFYHAHHLLSVSDGLWMPALFCCVFYTVSAWLLKDSLFVYVLVGGVTLTGLLILGEMNRFGEILAPTMLLVGLALVCLHAERAFPPGEGPSPASPSPPGRGARGEGFGMAFYWSSHVLLGVGLLLLLAAQLIGWLHEPLFRHFGMDEPPDVAKREFLPWTLGLTLAGTWAYLYSDFVVRRIGVYIYLAAVTILWSEVQVLVLADLANVDAVVIATLSVTALAFNVLQGMLRKNLEFLRFVPPLGLMLSAIPVGLGVLLHFRAVNAGFKDFWPFAIQWDYVAAMLLCAVCCRYGAFLYRHSAPEISIAYFFLTMAATLTFAAGLTWMLGLKPWEEAAPLLMLIPIIYLIAARLYRGHSPEKPLILVAHVATGIMIYTSIMTSLGITPQAVQPVQGRVFNLLLSAFAVEAALFYGLAAVLQRAHVCLYFAAVMLCGAIWQLLLFFETPSEVYVVAYALTGFTFLVVYRSGVLESMDMPTLERAVFHSGNAFSTLGVLAGALLAVSRWGAREVGDWQEPLWMTIYLLGFLIAANLASAYLVRQAEWRRAYLIFALGNGALLALMIHKLLKLNPWQAVEYVTVGVGVLLVIAAYVGWQRETERVNDLVSLGFVFGSLAMVVPLFLATAIHRFGEGISLRDELGLVVACLALFISGVMCRIRATTLVGGVAMLLYLVMLLVYMHRFLKETVIIGVYLTLGGVILFGTGLILSVYRDRLMRLSERFRRREGIFRVFEWR